jgi:hypothetical protein
MELRQYDHLRLPVLALAGVLSGCGAALGDTEFDRANLP